MRLRPSATVALSLSWLFLLLAARDDAAAGPGAQADARPSPELVEYIDVLVTLGKQALAEPRLRTPMPCLAHWLAGNDHVIVAVSEMGQQAGLETGGTLRRIGDHELTGIGAGLWDAALRALPAGRMSFPVSVARNGKLTRFTLPCAPERALAFHRGERAIWTAVVGQDWRGCTAAGRDMINAFGTDISPSLMLMSQCATASGVPDPGVTDALARALLSEMVAHPDPQPDLRAQLFLAWRQLDAIRGAGGPDYATSLREEMARRGVPPPAR